MEGSISATESTERAAAIDMTPEDFRRLGHRLIDDIADFLGSLPQRPVAPGASPGDIRDTLGSGSLPETGTDPTLLLAEACALLFEHSTFNGHPRFMGYVTSSPTPIGALSELLAAAINPNVGAWSLSPMASEIERQTVRWLAELLGLPAATGGLLVSGGNMANFVCFLAARTAKAPWDVQKEGTGRTEGGLRVYASTETHAWLVKAADLFGLGTEAIRWIPTDQNLAIDVAALEARIDEDRRAGLVPFLVVGSAGTVSTGAIDPLDRLAEVCRQHDLWFHVDGAYGAPAVVAPDAPESLKALRLADSVAIDPHKWLYAPLEAGCALVRDPQTLLNTFSHHPAYYHFDQPGQEEAVNFYEYGLQNSRGFRALKVWLALRQIGREGYAWLIAEDIALSQELYRRVAAEPELEAFTQGLSICTFRYAPADLQPGIPETNAYLNRLNEALLKRIEASGELFLSNAVIGDAFVLRSCIVNFRTARSDIAAIPGIVTWLGREVDRELRDAPYKGTVQ